MFQPWTLVTLVIIYCMLTVQVTGQSDIGYACVNDDMNLQCPDSKNISISRGDLGQYEPACPDSDPCCPPQATDCTGDLEELYPSDMEDLREACDGQNSCSYRVLGGNLDMCSGVRQAQYLQVFHRCLPEDPTTVAPTTEEVTQPPTTGSSTTTPQQPPGASTTPSDEGDGGLSGGVIAAIVVGVILLIAIGVMAGVIIWRKLHPPPKPKKVVRRRVGKKSTTVYDNQAFASSDQVVVHLNDESKTIPNGVHNNNKANGGAPVPPSDGKRKPRPVTAAESFRYAQEKEALASKYKTGSGNTDRKTKSSKAKKAPTRNPKDSPSEHLAPDSTYYNMAGSPQGKSSDNER